LTFSTKQQRERFREEREDVGDDFKSGRPSTSRTSETENIQHAA